MRLLAAVISSILLSACATTGNGIAVSEPYQPSAYDAYRLEGKNTVAGQAFMRQAGGGTVTCAGTTAALFPASPYFREVLSAFAKGLNPITPNQNESSSVPGSPIKRTQCDAQGNFQIDNVPAGKWILVSKVTWMVGRMSQGGTLQREIEVVDGAQNRFLLTDSHRVGGT